MLSRASEPQGQLGCFSGRTSQTWLGRQSPGSIKNTCAHRPEDPERWGQEEPGDVLSDIPQGMRVVRHILEPFTESNSLFHRQETSTLIFSSHCLWSCGASASVLCLTAPFYGRANSLPSESPAPCLVSPCSQGQLHAETPWNDASSPGTRCVCSRRPGQLS